MQKKYVNTEIEIAGSPGYSEDLWKLSKSVNDSYLKMKAAFGEDDGGDATQFMLRRIPFLYFQNGEGSRMHIPSDTGDKIDFRKLERITRTVKQSPGHSPTHLNGQGLASKHTLVKDGGSGTGVSRRQD